MAGEFGYEIVILPGFEIAATIGGGVHVLCLFEPGTAIETASEKLTALGLPTDHRSSSGNPNPVPQDVGLNLNVLLRVVQDDATTPGPVIMALLTGG